jgi:hypothetical protein
MIESNKRIDRHAQADIEQLVCLDLPRFSLNRVDIFGLL